MVSSLMPDHWIRNKKESIMRRSMMKMWTRRKKKR